MADVSSSSSSSGAPAPAPTSSSPPPLSSELQGRSSSTPPELDQLSSTNVFAFGLHSSYAAFANDGASSLSPATAGSSPPPSAQRSGGGGAPGGLGGTGGASNLAALSSMHLNMSMMGLMPMPGMESSSSSSSFPPSASAQLEAALDGLKGAGGAQPWQVHAPSMDFAQLSLGPSSPLLHLSPGGSALGSPTSAFPSAAFLFGPPSAAQPSGGGAPNGGSGASLHSTHAHHAHAHGQLPDASESSLLPLDPFHPYYYQLQPLPPLPLQSAAFDPFSLPSLPVQLSLYLTAAGDVGRGPLNPSICKFYAAGHCARGEHCNYAHVRADGTHVSAPAMRGAGGGRGAGMQGSMGGGLMVGRGRGRGDVRGGERDRGRSARAGGAAAFRGPRMVHALQPQPQPHFSPHPGHGPPQPHAALHKDGGGMHAVHGGLANSSNPLSPLSPSLVALHPLADPTLLLHSPPFPPLDYPSMYASYGSSGEYFDAQSTLGMGLSASADELSGRVYALARDQYGCRLLQRLLDEQREGVAERIFEETFAHVNELMTDPFGNYLVQKLIEHCADAQRMAVLARVSADLVAISLNLHGTRAVQKLVETLSAPAEVELLVAALQGSAVTLIKDLNGNHVIQRCLHHLSSRDNQWIIDAVCRHCVSVSTHKHGCCVLQRCIDYATVSQKRQLIHEICTNALELVQDVRRHSTTQHNTTHHTPSPRATALYSRPSAHASLAVCCAGRRLMATTWCSTCWTSTTPRARRPS